MRRTINRWLWCILPGVLGLVGFGLEARAAVLGLQPVAVNLTNITSITSARDGSGRLFITEQKSGLVKIFDGSTVLPTNFLNVASLISTGGSEEGLLGTAFSPGYHTNGFFYVSYTASNQDVILSRYTVSGNPNVANPIGEVLLDIPHPTYSNHNGGQLRFGPDGYLYMSLGDGGFACDPFNNAQNLSALLGKILRIDVSTAPGYAIPPSNPFVSVSGAAQEIWAYGLRNPWRFSFDRLTGDLYIGDAGEAMREEVDLQPAGDPGGENYGWRLYEGFLTNTCAVTFSNVASTLPIFDYNHTNGNCVVIGGHVYRGIQNPFLVGDYVYGDFCSGTISVAVTNGAGGWTEAQVLKTNLSFSTFGEDEAGELYVASYATGSSGILFHIVAPDTVGDAIPDWWRMAYFGGTGATTNQFSCALCDPDGDGMSNYQEFKLGTDPTNSASSLHVTSITRNSNDLCITWMTVASATNIVQGSVGGGSYSNAFVDLSPPIVVAGSGLAITNYICVGCATNLVTAYYRVKVPRPVMDDTSDPVYNGGWFNGANGGSGFTSWQFAVGPPAAFATNSFFVGSSTNNGNGNSPGIDVNGKSWEISTVGRAPLTAFRAFAGGPLLVGQTFQVSLDTGDIDPNYQSGFTLKNSYAHSASVSYSTGARWQFLYNVNDPTNSYKVIDAAGLYNIAVPFTNTGLRLVFTLNTVNTYTLLVIDNASGATNATVNGTLANTTGRTIDSFAFFNSFFDSANSPDGFYINSLRVTGP